MMWLFDIHIHFEMATIVKLIISIASHNYLCVRMYVCVCVCMMKTLKIYFFSKCQAYKIV